jgi:type I restriction enzyme S subunit
MREGWGETTLGDVADVVGGGTPSTSIAEYWNGDIIWLTPTEITSQDGKVVTDSIRKISNAGFKNSGAQMLPKGSVILTSRASVGYVALSGLALCTNQGFQSLVPKESAMAEFLMFWIQQNRAEFESRSAGSTFKEISKSNVKSIKIFLPPIVVQKRIVDLVSSVDSYLAKLRDTLAKSVAARKSAIETQLNYFNDSAPIFKLEELCAKGKSAIVDGPFGANLKRGDYLNEGIPVLKIQNIKQDFIVIKKMDFVNEKKFLELRRHSFQTNDFVMTKLGDPLGLSAVVRDLEKGLIVADLVRIRPDKIDVEFLCIQLNSARIQNYINRMQKGSTRPRVNLGMIRELPIVVPSDEEVRNFVSVFGSWSQHNKVLEEAISATEELRRGLLFDLLSGKHEIPASYDKYVGVV